MIQGIDMHWANVVRNQVKLRDDIQHWQDDWKCCRSAKEKKSHQDLLEHEVYVKISIACKERRKERGGHVCQRG